MTTEDVAMMGAGATGTESLAMDVTDIADVIAAIAGMVVIQARQEVRERRALLVARERRALRVVREVQVPRVLWAVQVPRALQALQAARALQDLGEVQVLQVLPDLQAY